MLLCIDIGNTNIKLGLFESGELRNTFRMTTKLNSTSDEYGVYIREFLSSDGLKPKDVENVIISSVVPMLNYTFEHLCEYYFKKKPLFVSHKLKTGLKIDYENPSSLGADRIVTAVAAARLYGKHDGKANTVPVIAVDFGTALTINVIAKEGIFLGGLIFPGVKASAECLVRSTARLPNVVLSEQEQAVGKNTEACIQSGLYFGYIGAVEYIIQKIKKEQGMENAVVVATGGLSELFINGTEVFSTIDRKLSLIGLNMIYALNV